MIPQEVEVKECSDEELFQQAEQPDNAHHTALYRDSTEAAEEELRRRGYSGRQISNISVSGNPEHKSVRDTIIERGVLEFRLREESMTNGDPLPHIYKLITRGILYPKKGRSIPDYMTLEEAEELLK